MKWPWTKKVETPKPEPVKPVEYPDDWSPAVGDWVSVESCHCGQRRKTWATGVCQTCGCEGRWSTRVERDEWEESPSRRDAWNSLWMFDSPRSPHPSFYCRSVIRVIWSAEKCKGDTER